MVRPISLGIKYLCGRFEAPPYHTHFDGRRATPERHGPNTLSQVLPSAPSESSAAARGVCTERTTQRLAEHDGTPTHVVQTAPNGSTAASTSTEAQLVSSSPSEQLDSSAAAESSQTAPLRLWTKAKCDNCNELSWVLSDNAATTAAMRCHACTANPDRVGQCAICFESCLPFRLDHTIDGPPRGHDRQGRPTQPWVTCAVDNVFCKACVRSHCAMQLDGGAIDCGCPAVGCVVPLSEGTLTRLSRDLTTQRANNQHAARREHQATALEQHEDLLRWALDNSAQCCPFCYALVQKSAGCRHMVCRCGKEFCYVCGEPYPCSRSSCSDDDDSPRFAAVVLEELRSRRDARLHAFRCGMHPVAGAASAVRLLPLELLATIEAMV
jgi:hypothetical protein